MTTAYLDDRMRLPSSIVTLLAVSMAAILICACSSSDEEATKPTTAPPVDYFWETRSPIGFSDFRAVGVATKDTLYLAIANDPQFDENDPPKSTLVSYDRGDKWDYGANLTDLSCSPTIWTHFLCSERSERIQVSRRKHLDSDDMVRGG